MYFKVSDEKVHASQYIHQTLVRSQLTDKIVLHLHQLQSLILECKYVKPYFGDSWKEKREIIIETQIEKLKCIYEYYVFDKQFLRSDAHIDMQRRQFRLRKNAIDPRDVDKIKLKHNIIDIDLKLAAINAELKQEFLRRGLSNRAETLWHSSKTSEAVNIVHRN